MSFANKKLSFVLGAVALSVSSWVNAQAGHAHVHGAASMNLVMEGDKVFVEFESPMASIVGFEYKPETRVEKVKVKDAFAALKSDKLFIFEGTSCRLQSIESNLPWEDDGHDSHDHDEHAHDEHDHDEHDHDEHDHNEHDHDEHDHDKHDHDEHDHDKQDHDKHEHDEHDEHDDDKHDHDKHDHDEHDHEKHDHDEHDHGEHEKETHSDVALNYRFACKGDVKALKLGHFETFPLMDSLKVQWIGKGGQGAESLSKSKDTITF